MREALLQPLPLTEWVMAVGAFSELSEIEKSNPDMLDADQRRWLAMAEEEAGINQ